jgi:hypothetical protein
MAAWQFPHQPSQAAGQAVADLAQRIDASQLTEQHGDELVQQEKPFASWRKSRMAFGPREFNSRMGSKHCFQRLSEVQQNVTGSYGVEAPILLGLAISCSALCLATLLSLCSVLLLTVWVTSEIVSRSWRFAALLF